MRHHNSQQAQQAGLWIIILALLAVIATTTIVRGEEKFIRSDRAAGASVELRQETTVIGQEIRFRQITRWADADKDMFDPLGDLVVARFGEKQGVRSITIGELRNLLRDAGVNASMMNFVGSLTCTVHRSDTSATANQQMEQLITQKSAEKGDVLQGGSNAGSKDAGGVEFVEHERPAVQSLESALTADLASRLDIPVETLQMTFRGEDDKVLRLSSPQFRFSISPQRVSNLGEVSWQVTISSDAGSTKSFIQARAQAWQNQLIVNRSLATKQLITDADLVERRALVDRLGEDTLLTRQQAVGQAASRDLKSGTLMTGKLVDAVQLVRPGQFVTIEHSMGAVRVKIVARAIDGGTYGQSIRVKNETTREILRVTVTGAQQASINAPDVNSKAVAMGGQG